jgi:hypothetical protein
VNLPVQRKDCSAKLGSPQKGWIVYRVDASILKMIKEVYGSLR